MGNKNTNDGQGLTLPQLLAKQLEVYRTLLPQAEDVNRLLASGKDCTQDIENINAQVETIESMEASIHLAESEWLAQVQAGRIDEKQRRLAQELKNQLRAVIENVLMQTSLIENSLRKSMRNMAPKMSHQAAVSRMHRAYSTSTHSKG